MDLADEGLLRLADGANARVCHHTDDGHARGQAGERFLSSPRFRGLGVAARYKHLPFGVTLPSLTPQSLCAL